MRKSVAFFTFDQLGHRNSASSRIRAEWLTRYMPEAELFRYGKPYDVIVFDKVFMPDFLKIFPGKKIIDVCDPIWYEIVRLKETIELADAVTCPTEPLAAVLQQLTTKPVRVIKDRHDPAFFPEIHGPHSGPARSAVWYGYSAHLHALDLFRAELKRRKLKLTIISDRPHQLPGVETTYTKWNVKTVNAEIIKHDLVLAPKGMSPAFKYKSNNRTVNGWFLRMPVATTIPELTRFQDGAEREAEATRRLTEAHAHWTVDRSVAELRELISTL